MKLSIKTMGDFKMCSVYNNFKLRACELHSVQ